MCLCHGHTKISQKAVKLISFVLHFKFSLIIPKIFVDCLPYASSGPGPLRVAMNGVVLALLELEIEEKGGSKTEQRKSSIIPQTLDGILQDIM